MMCIFAMAYRVRYTLLLHVTYLLLATAILIYDLNENAGQTVNDYASYSYPGTLGTSSLNTNYDPIWSTVVLIPNESLNF